ncbi:MAG TPA: hypothetical protein VJO33_04125 [Gemmatimonadaceae bacterium]|nr:hypothetical protein [Gemmatimonadaceae bacterium]
MSNPNTNEGLSPDVPKFEPWLAVMLLAIVPMLAALALSREFVLHLTAVSSILFVAAIGMLVVQERRKKSSD